MKDWISLNESQPPDESVVHLRGLWVYHHRVDIYEWQSDTGYVSENGRFIGSNDEDFGWESEDYTHWMPLPEPPQMENN